MYTKLLRDLYATTLKWFTEGERDRVPVYVCGERDGKVHVAKCYRLVSLANNIYRFLVVFLQLFFMFEVFKKLNVIQVEH